MERKRAEEILGDIKLADNSLDSIDWYLSWEVGEEEATLDGRFFAEELEAIAWWMRNKKEGEEDGKSDTTE